MNGSDGSNHNNNEYQMPQGHPPYYGHSTRRRSKWLAGLLAFLIPGTGHMYLGLMFKAVTIMLLIAANIAAIVQMSSYRDNALTIVLLSLMLPIIYFYNLFDAIQSTEIVNERLSNAQWNAYAAGPERRSGGAEFRSITSDRLIVLIAAGVVVFLLMQGRWKDWVFDSTLSMIGAVLLIAGGVVLWIRELRHPQEPKQ